MNDNINLQSRARAAASQFAERARRPLVIEFAGVPKAGKTTTLSQVQTFLKRCGFRTEVVIERASVCPIRDKKHANFNVWTACTTMSQILEKTQNPPLSEDPQILFLDRGIFDSICWMTMMERFARIRQDQRQRIQEFLMIDDWRKRISAVFVMLASAKDAMKREQGLLPVDEVTGSIMNYEVLEQIRETNLQCIKELGEDFRIYPIDTSFGDTKDCPKRTAEVVAEAIVGLAEEHISEEVLSCPTHVVTDLFGDKNFIDAASVSPLIQRLTQDHPDDFVSREQVEQDTSRIQAIPIVIVRRANGDVLRLCRREKKSKNPLHEKVVIWAGGHVRREDAATGNPLLSCAIRELEEELRLQLEESSLKPLGAVYFDNGGSTSRHVGIVYEWVAPTDDVSVVLSRTEFFERRGTSLSGSFASVDTLSRDVQTQKMNEPWSVELIRGCLAPEAFESEMRLF